ncbi:MAG TPA: GNAT family N-acetyltransferase [Thermodesulfobacteriota bacterium]|nr:GNAT family N-acetyltransferase [Thermodesulfobacteriota bacterium]
MRRLNNHVDDIAFKLYSPFSQFDDVKEIWTSMLKKCPHSYYLAWPWTELWIKSLPDNCSLSLVAGFINKSPVVAFFLGAQTTTRHRLFKFRKLSINQTFIPNIDIIWIEYNGILIDPEITITLGSLLENLPVKSWDEFSILRCSPVFQPNLIIDDDLDKKYHLEIHTCESFYVDLNKIRSNDDDYFGLLSPNRRQQIRRSIKEYEKFGAIEIAIAANTDEALALFDELTEIHQKTWTEEGHTGALSDSYIIDFHKNLISRRFEHGEIQLIKVSAGAHVLGCIYNLIYEGKVYFYICGFNYLPGNLYRSGLVCHSFAIMHNARLGLNSYDFLEGDDSYRKSLSTDHNEMQTITIRKRDMKYRAASVIDAIRSGKKH